MYSRAGDREIILIEIPCSHGPPWEQSCNGKNKHFFLARFVMSERHKIEAFSFQGIKIHILAANIIFLVYPSLATAADNYWNVASGNWSDTNPSPWSLGTEPTSSGWAYMSNGGTAIITQSGETCLGLELGFFIGNPPFSKGPGEVQMTGGSLSVSFEEMIGDIATGTFSQYGGINTTVFLELATMPGVNGIYNLSGTGQLSVSNEEIGIWGIGTFTQTGGIHTVSFDTQIGYDTGIGIYNHSAGTNTITNNVYLGYPSNANGTYNLSETGQLSANNEYIGNHGTGTFMQTGGTNTVTNNLYLAYYSDAKGTYSLSGTGQLSAKYEYIGFSGTGSFTQTGGTNSSEYIKICTNGAYTLSSGTMQIKGGLALAGTLDLSGNSTTITASNVILDFAQGGSIHNASLATLNVGTNSLVIIPSDYDLSSVFKTFINSGILHTKGTTLTLIPTQSFSGCGDIDDYVDCQGTITDSENGFINFNNGLMISGAGSVYLRNIGLRTDDSSAGISGGTLIVNNQYVGDSGNGTFTSSAGSDTISSNLYLGNTAGAYGTYNLGGTGLLSVTKYEYIGYSGTGVFMQTGGTNTISSALYLGYNSGSCGTYNLTGGTLILKSISKGSGAAYFNFGGGTLRASSSFIASLPMTLTGTGGNANIDTVGYAITLSGIISGNGALNKLGSGTLTLSGANTYSGGTTLYGGYIAASSLGNFGSGNITFDGGGLTFNGSFDPSSLGITINSGGAIFNTNNYLITFSNALSGTGGVSKIGYGTLTLSGSNTYAGGTVVSAGYIQLGNASALGTGGLTVNSGGIVNLNNYAVNLTSLSGSGGSITDSSTGTGTTALNVTNSLSTSFAGVIKDGSYKKLALIKKGIGTLTLSGNNTYSGETDINAGTLAINVSLRTTGLVVVNDGGILGGTGTVGNVTVYSGGHIAPGNSAGVLVLWGNLTLNDGALLDFELANTSASDKISMSNSTLYLNGLDYSDFTFTALNKFGKGTYMLIDAKIISGSLGSNLTGTIGDYSATLSKLGNDLILTVVPEPGAWVLLATACLAIFIGKRMGWNRL
jgi:autotransporter-associated beta strand protein